MTKDNRTAYEDPAADGAYTRLEAAWQWLCRQREMAPEGADVWDIRWQHLQGGPAYLSGLLRELLDGRYRLSPLQLYGRGHNRKAVWGAQDALVLKWVAFSLENQLPLHPACEHVKGHGGGKPSVQKLHDLLTQQAAPDDICPEKKTDDASSLTYPWVCRTDIRGYYRHISKKTLLAQVKQYVRSRVLRDLITQYVHYSVEDGGTFHTPTAGISRGCPLSPLMGALHLYDMDAHFGRQEDIHYARYMDDIIILAKTRWSLRRQTKSLLQWFSSRGFEAHPDKTFIGRTKKGFDWMGAWLTHEGVTDIAPRAKANHREKVRRLYEQLARLPAVLRKRREQQVRARVSTYRKRWHIWAGALMLSAGTCHADRVLVVLAPNLPAGISTLPGGDFHLLADRPVQVAKSFADLSSTQTTMLTVAMGINDTGNPGWCGNDDFLTGLIWCQPLGDGRYGIKIKSDNVYLVPTSGTISARLGNYGGTYPVDPSQPAGVGCPTSTWGGAPSMLDCNSSQRYELETQLDAKPGGFNTIAADCSGNPIHGSSDGTPNQTCAGYHADFYLTPVCKDCTPGATNIWEFDYGDVLYRSFVPVPKPTAVIVSGLTCNLSTNGGPTFNIVPNVSVGQASAATKSLTVTCSGANTTNPPTSFPVGLALTPLAPTIVSTDNGGKLTTNDGTQPSFSTTITTGSLPDCSGTGANSVNFATGGHVAVDTYKPGDVGRASPVTLIWALCPTADTSQPPGHYQQQVLATIVSY